MFETSSGYFVKLENVAVVMHCNLKAAQRRTSRLGLFLAKFVLLMRRNCHFRASGQILTSP